MVLCGSADRDNPAWDVRNVVRSKEMRRVVRKVCREHYSKGSAGVNHRVQASGVKTKHFGIRVNKNLSCPEPCYH